MTPSLVAAAVMEAGLSNQPASGSAWGRIRGARRLVVAPTQTVHYCRQPASERTVVLARTLVIAVAALAAGIAAAPAQAAVPAGFTDQLVATVGVPTAIAFTPDGRGLITTQGGQLRVLTAAGALVGTPALDFSTKMCTNSERGMLGVAVDPAFATNGFVYLYYTLRKGAACDATAVNRVSRVVLSAANVAGSEVVLIDNIHSPAGNHNGGDLQFGKDGNLYISVGDGGCDYAGGGCAGANNAARDRHALLGKILRITPSGGIPADNPFQGAGTGRCNVAGITTAGWWCQETYAWGLRNPYRMAFDPNAAGTRFHINDVGQAAWEEIDLGAAGADYGWNVREGFCVNGSLTNCGPPPTGMTNPIFTYGRSDGCTSITGGAFVPTGVWPAAYQGKYMFADFVCGKIFRLDPDGLGGFTRVDFATGLSSVVHLTFGPVASTRALYYTTYAAGGQVRRIRSTAALTVTTAGSGSGFVDSVPAGIDCGRNIAAHADCTEAVPQGDAVTLTAHPAAGTQFAGFVGAGCTGGPTCTVTMTDARAVTATFCPAASLPAVVRGSTGWHLRNVLSSGAATASFSYGTRPMVGVMGDWDGNCTETVGSFEGGAFKLRNTNGPGAADTTVTFGDPRGFALAGDFNADGTDDLAVFRNGTWEVRDMRSATTRTFVYGTGSWPSTVPVTGDWNGDGIDGIGTYTLATGVWSLRNTADAGSPDVAAPFVFGSSTRYPVIGDWNGDGTDTVATKLMSAATWQWRNSNGAGAVDGSIEYGMSNDLPLAWR